jgi:hypothetical protein
MEEANSLAHYDKTTFAAVKSFTGPRGTKLLATTLSQKGNFCPHPLTMLSSVSKDSKLFENASPDSFIVQLFFSLSNVSK